MNPHFKLHVENSSTYIFEIDKDSLIWKQFLTYLTNINVDYEVYHTMADVLVLFNQFVKNRVETDDEFLTTLKDNKELWSHHHNVKVKDDIFKIITSYFPTFIMDAFVNVPEFNKTCCRDAKAQSYNYCPYCGTNLKP